MLVSETNTVALKSPLELQFYVKLEIIHNCFVTTVLLAEVSSLT